MAPTRSKGDGGDGGATKKPASIPRKRKQGSALIDAMIDVAAEQSVMDPQPDKNDNPEPPRHLRRAADFIIHCQFSIMCLRQLDDYFSVVRQQHLRRRAARHLRRAATPSSRRAGLVQHPAPQKVDAARRSKIAEIVIDLFLLTTKMNMNYVEKSVFGIKDGAPIMDNEHPAIWELFRIYNGPGNCPV